MGFTLVNRVKGSVLDLSEDPAKSFLLGCGKCVLVAAFVVPKITEVLVFRFW